MNIALNKQYLRVKKEFYECVDRYGIKHPETIKKDEEIQQVVTRLMKIKREIGV